jgi:hypothetical protein
MSRNAILILSRFRYVTIDEVWIGQLNLFTTCIHRSELHVITALSIISTSNTSLQHPLSLPPDCCVFNSCSLAMASNNGYSSASSAHVVTVRRIFCNWTLSTVNWTTAPSLLSLPCTAQLNCQPSNNWVPGWWPLHINPPSLLFTGWLTTQLRHFTSLNWTGQLVFKIPPRRVPHRKIRSTVARVTFRGNMFTEPLLRNGLNNPVIILLRACMFWALPSNCRCLQSHRLATGLYATILYVLIWRTQCDHFKKIIAQNSKICIHFQIRSATLEAQLN